MSQTPTLSVVINTYSGADVLPRAVSSVLSQLDPSIELIVADDGSEVSPDALLAEAFPAASLRVVSHPNAGLSAARNMGARAASSDFVLFLDDDDELMPGALAAVTAMLAPGIGIVSGGVEVIEVGSDAPPWYRYPKDLGPEMDHEVASYLAGSFAIDRKLLFDLGGFDEDLRCNHQRELFLRAVPQCRRAGLSIVSCRTPLLRMYRRPSQHRPRNEPARLQDCLERMLHKHREQLSRNPSELASVLSTAGVAAARNRQYSAARGHFRGAVRVRPSTVANWARLMASCVPPLARRLW
jgi:hypothetical protein